MKKPTRQILIQAMALATFSGGAAHAQPYPSKAVRFLVGFAPGGSTDVVARLTAERLKDTLGQPVVVDNRSGAGGNIAAETVAKAAPDGYTVLIATTGIMSINDKLYAGLPYNALKDFAPVIHMVNLPLLLVTHPALPVKSVKELTALAKQRPGELNFASSGVGSSTHMSGELFKSLAAINITHVPYKGSTQAMLDALSGQIALMFDQITTAGPQVNAGKLRALAISSASRSALWPGMPTVAESGVPGYESISFSGMVVPAGTPQAIIYRLNAEMGKTLGMQDMKARLFELGAEPVGGTPEQFAAYYKAEAGKWGRLLSQLGIRPQ